MKQLYIVLLFSFVLIDYLLAQSRGEIYREAYPEYVEKIADSYQTQLWREMISARKAHNISLHETLRAQYERDYSHAFSSAPSSPNDPFAIRPVQGQGFTGDWRDDDVTIYPGNVLEPSTTATKRNVRLAVDSLGNKYAAFMTSNGDTLLVYRSVDHGSTWSRIAEVFPGDETKWHSFDVFVTDSANTHKLGFAASRRVGTGPHGGEIFWLSMNSDGSGFWTQQIASRPAGRGLVNPAIVSDGYLYSPELTYWYVTYQNVDSSTGVGNAALAALSQNWGSSWLVATARSAYNDFDLDIDFTAGGNTIAVLLTNDLTVTNPNLRIRFVALSNFTGTWSQINPASTSDPEFGSVLVTNRQTNALLVMYTVTQSGNNNIGYAYNLTGSYVLSNWTVGQILAAGSNSESRVSVHCQEAEGLYRVAYVSSGPSRDTVIYTSSASLPSGFSDRTIVNADRNANTTIAPSAAGFRINAQTFDEGVVFIGAGSSGVFYDGSNLRANTPPLAFNLLNPPDGDTLTVNDTLRYQWERATDPDPGDTVRYALYRSSDGGSTWPMLIVTTDTSYSPPAGLVVGTYLWLVIATDGIAFTAGADTFSYVVTPAVSIRDRNAQSPPHYSLSQNYPNPLNPTTQIQYALPRESSVKLVVYNLLGQEVAKLIDAQQSAGYHEVAWNGRNTEGSTIGSGLYFYRIEARASDGNGTFMQMKKMLLLK
jgi:hypothetical protein